MEMVSQTKINKIYPKENWNTTYVTYGHEREYWHTVKEWITFFKLDQTTRAFLRS